MAKRDYTGFVMTKRDYTGFVMAKRDYTGFVMAKRDYTGFLTAKLDYMGLGVGQWVNFISILKMVMNAKCNQSMIFESESIKNIPKYHVRITSNQGNIAGKT